MSFTGLPPTMFFAGPIRKADGTDHCSRNQDAWIRQKISHGSLQFSRVGSKTGETYAFDQEAEGLLSESRFVDDLRQIGLLKEGRSAASLNIEIRDPGGNMVEGYRSEGSPIQTALYPHDSRRFTIEIPGLEKRKMPTEHSAIKTDMTGYRDYRGVPVFGAWQWDFELGMGITSEIDVVRGVVHLLYTMRLTVLGVLGVTLFLSVRCYPVCP